MPILPARPVVAYVRVSTREQGDSGLGLAAQHHAVQAECARRGWDLARTYSDVASGKSTDRPGLTAAMAALDSGLVTGLVVAKIDRLSRSLFDFAGIVATAQTKNWALVVADLGVDASTPAGALVCNVIASLAQWERAVISERTRDALPEASGRRSQARPPVPRPRRREGADPAGARRGDTAACHRPRPERRWCPPPRRAARRGTTPPCVACWRHREPAAGSLADPRHGVPWRAMTPPSREQCLREFYVALAAAYIDTRRDVVAAEPREQDVPPVP